MVQGFASDFGFGFDLLNTGSHCVACVHLALGLSVVLHGKESEYSDDFVVGGRFCSIMWCFYEADDILIHALCVVC